MSNLAVSWNGRRYGRHQPAPLSAHMMLTRITPTIPPVVDLRAWCGNVKNQGNMGSCVGHAFSSSIEWIRRKYFNESPTLSPLYLYVKSLQADNDYPQDNGTNGTTAALASIVYGCCEDALYPDSSQVIIHPTSKMNANAALYRNGSYHGLVGSSVALSILGDPVPWPVQIGFNVYESFESDYTANTGIMTIPNRNEQLLGGHEVMIIGYDAGPTPVIRPAACPPAVLCMNSWDTDWGIKGFFWMPLPILDDSSVDMRISHTGNPWP
jgi:Papain family cysteine protease